MDKDALVAELKQAVAETTDFCRQLGIDLSRIQSARSLEKVKLKDEAVEAILINEESKKRYNSLALQVNQLYKAILPDERANEFNSTRTLIMIIFETIRSLSPEVDISDVIGNIERLLDRSIASEGYVIDKLVEEHLVDLSKIDFEKLRVIFEKNRKRTTAERLKGAIEKKLDQMIALNRTRIDFQEKFQKMIDEYNSGAYNIEVFFDRLIEFAGRLDEEEQRAIRENLTEEELVIFDLLTKPEMRLTQKETQGVKKVAKDLLETLKNEKLVLDWRKRQQSRASVRLSIEVVLDKLPRAYTKEMYQQKCDVIYQHVYESYFGGQDGIYA